MALRHSYKPHKYNAKPKEFRGRVYPSTLQANYAARLFALQEAGVIVGYWEEVPFRFPDGNKYVADFAIFWGDGRCDLVDTKGPLTAEFKIKARMMEHYYPWCPLRITHKVDI